MGGHISQSGMSLRIDRFGWVYRLAIENVDRCDWDYRLLIENTKDQKAIEYSQVSRLTISHDG